jgi:hypothetical protein
MSRPFNSLAHANAKTDLSPSWLCTRAKLGLLVSIALLVWPNRDAAAQSSRPEEKTPTEDPSDPKPKPKRRKKPATKKPTKITMPEPDTSADEWASPAMPPSPAIEPRPDEAAPPVAAPPTANEPAPVTAPASGAAPEPRTATVPEAPRGQPTPSIPTLNAESATALHLGAHYRLGILPKGMISLLARGGNTYVFHFVGVDLDVRWRRFSITPALSYASLSTPGDAFGDRNFRGPSYTVYLKSELSAVLATVDFAWTFPVSRSIDAELGVGLGFGIPMGSLINNWVYEKDDGPLTLGETRGESKTLIKYAQCQNATDGVGCRPQDHPAQTSSVRIRVDGYRDRGWLEGGSSPTVIPWVAIPQMALRLRVSSAFAMRLGVGLATTGLWVGIGLTRALSAEQHEH